MMKLPLFPFKLILLGIVGISEPILAQTPVESVPGNVDCPSLISNYNNYLAGSQNQYLQEPSYVVRYCTQILESSNEAYNYEQNYLDHLRYWREYKYIQEHQTENENPQPDIQNQRDY